MNQCQSSHEVMNRRWINDKEMSKQFNGKILLSRHLTFEIWISLELCHLSFDIYSFPQSLSNWISNLTPAPVPPLGI